MSPLSIFVLIVGGSLLLALGVNLWIRHSRNRFLARLEFKKFGAVRWSDPSSGYSMTTSLVLWVDPRTQEWVVSDKFEVADGSIHSASEASLWPSHPAGDIRSYSEVKNASNTLRLTPVP